MKIHGDTSRANSGARGYPGGISGAAHAKQHPSATRATRRWATWLALAAHDELHPLRAGDLAGGRQPQCADGCVDYLEFLPKKGLSAPVFRHGDEGMNGPLPLLFS